MRIALITSTIAPQKNAYALSVTDEHSRLRDYESALHFYSKCLANGVFDRIVYVDNSGFSLSSLKQITKAHELEDKVEFISYTSDLDASKHGRFYLELNLIDHFMNHSKILKEFPDAYVWKLTGRYTIKNISKLMPRTQSGYDLFINCRDYPTRTVDFYLVGFNKKAYETFFLANLEKFSGPVTGESILRKVLDENDQQVAICSRLPKTPLISGTRGYDGATYGKGKDLIKYYVRECARIFFPFIRA